MTCARCKIAFYCSMECQAKQWKAGHKTACRKRGEVKPGDIIYLAESEGRPELTGSIVRAIERANNVEEATLWRVECLRGTVEPFQVPDVSLLRFRPLW
jgi:hypothetical protein